MKKKSREKLNDISLDPTKGLTDEEVKERIEKGYQNSLKDPSVKSTGKILKDNFLPFFNIVLYIIAILFLTFEILLRRNGETEVLKRYFGISKYGFLVPLLLNSLIGSIQEIHAKHTLSKLRLVAENKVTVIRNGKEISIPSHEIVLDDILLLKPGNQIPVDLIVLEGEAELDESMLTGESASVKKKEGEKLLAGSFLLTGHIRGRAAAVGEDTYASSLSLEVKSLANHKSQLMEDIYQILNFLSVLLFFMILLVTLTLVYKVYRWGKDPSVFDGMTMSLTSYASWGRMLLTVGAYTIGIIPTGLVLITSLTLALSILRLGKEHTLIQGLYSLENLSRVDTICLDKTGTLTDGSLSVESFLSFIPNSQFRSYLQSFNSLLPSDNPTGEALLSYFGKEENVKAKETYPFSPKTKYSGYLSIDNKKVLLGASEALFDREKEERLALAEEKASLGYRVLALSVNGVLAGFLFLKDNIRPSAKDTITYFYKNHVDVKILSGDFALTVSSIAKACGVKDSEKAINCPGKSEEELISLAEKETIFARLTPDQKKVLVEALQKKGHKVAMTGDGINDILALRKADCSISFLRATDAAKACADVVLLDNDFSHLKEVVRQGRRVVNNIERTSVLFLMKTVAILLLALFLIPFKKGQMWYSVENVYLLQTGVIAIGGFLLSLEGREKPIEGSFRSHVLSKAILGGIFVFLGAFLPIFLYTMTNDFLSAPLYSVSNTRSLISICTALAGYAVLLSLSYPFTRYRLLTSIAVLLVSFFFAFFSPRSYVGGAPTDISHFFDGDSFFTSTFMKECFQPWNAPVYQELVKEPSTYISLIFFVFAFIPLYFLISHFLKKHLEDISRLFERKKKVS